MDTTFHVFGFVFRRFYPLHSEPLCHSSKAAKIPGNGSFGRRQSICLGTLTLKVLDYIETAVHRMPKNYDIAFDVPSYE